MFSRLQIDIDALAFNYKLFAKASEHEAGAVVKADAYGLGVQRIAECLFDEGCRRFFFASFEEAFACDLGQGSTKYVLVPFGEKSLFQEAVREGIVPIFNSFEAIAEWQVLTDANYGLSVDTGMNRLGVRFDALDTVELDEEKLCLLMTHLACADEPDHDVNTIQIERFGQWAKRYPRVRTSIGNSAGTLLGEPHQGELTRPGIGLYGGNPFIDRPNPMHTVVRCEGAVLQQQVVKAGESIGYGATHILRRDTRIAVVGMGYADGVSRALSDLGEVAFLGVKLPIVGRVSMDSIQVDVTNAPTLEVGDYVEFFGDTISLDEVAMSLGTISYELLCGIGTRVPRQYESNG